MSRGSLWYTLQSHSIRTIIAVRTVCMERLKKKPSDQVFICLGYTIKFHNQTTTMPTRVESYVACNTKVAPTGTRIVGYFRNSLTLFKSPPRTQGSNNTSTVTSLPAFRDVAQHVPRSPIQAIVYSKTFQNICFFVQKNHSYNTRQFI